MVALLLVPVGDNVLLVPEEPVVDVPAVPLPLVVVAPDVPDAPLRPDVPIED